MRTIGVISAMVVVMACAASTPLPKQPKDIRQGIRNLDKGVTLYTRGCFEKALEHFYESHERYSAADHLQGTAHSLNSIANIYLQLGDIQSALLVYGEAIEFYRAAEDVLGQARAWCNRATALIEENRLEESEQALMQAEELVAGDHALIGLRAKNRVLLLIAQKRKPEAQILLSRTLSSLEEEDAVTVAGLYYLQGQLFLEQNQFSAALAPLESALELDRSAGAYHNIARDLESLGICLAGLERREEAVICQKRSAKIYALLQNPERVKVVMDQLEINAAHTQTDIKATRHWINQWLAGKIEANLCR
jgi:tetratricopeptide (TPR) repeat protein